MSFVFPILLRPNTTTNPRWRTGLSSSASSVTRSTNSSIRVDSIEEGLSPGRIVLDGSWPADVVGLGSADRRQDVREQHLDRVGRPVIVVVAGGHEDELLAGGDEDPLAERARGRDDVAAAAVGGEPPQRAVVERVSRPHAHTA